MKSYYHFERTGGYLHPGCQLTLRSVKPEWDSNFSKLNRRFPRGLSQFGLVYLCENSQPKPQVLIYREGLLEEIRRQHFPDRPSRFQSLFACRTPEEAIAMQREMKCEEATLWEVQSNNAFICDMYFTNIMPRSLSALSRRAKEEWVDMLHCYWRGEASENPNWECLLPLPVVVVQRYGNLVVGGGQ
jgi:hypothetical protein